MDVNRLSTPTTVRFLVRCSMKNSHLVCNTFLSRSFPFPVHGHPLELIAAYRSFLIYHLQGHSFFIEEQINSACLIYLPTAGAIMTSQAGPHPNP